jgi:hypothetical protein
VIKVLKEIKRQAEVLYQFSRSVSILVFENEIIQQIDYKLIKKKVRLGAPNFRAHT